MGREILYWEQSDPRREVHVEEFIQLFWRDRIRIQPVGARGASHCIGSLSE